MGRRNRHGRGPGPGTVILIVMLVTLAVAYGTGWYVLEGKFLPNTTVNGLDYSRMTPSEAEEAFKKTYMGRILTIREMGGAEEQIGYDDIDYRLTSNMTFQQLVDDQSYYLWPVTFFRNTIIETERGFAYDQDLLREKVHELNCISGEGIRDPSDAFLEKTEEGYSIHPENDGNRLDEEMVFELADKAVNAVDTVIDLEEEGCYLKAKIRRDNPDLVASFEAADKVQQTVVSAYMEGGVSETVDKSVFLDWMTVDGTNVTIDRDAVASYIASMAEKYNTLGKTREFRTYEGDVLTVGGSMWDDFGYQMNQDSSTDIVYNAILSGISQTVALDWTLYGRERDELGGDFGDTYIEISLDEQHMWYFKDGDLFLDTDIVSGEANEERATPPGVFCVLQKVQDHTMQGSYGRAFANYVLRVMNNGISIHDSSWRDEYGGDIWYYDGSHGCINTPYSAMQTLYENTDVSTPIIIYDRNNTVPVIKNTTYTGGETGSDWDDEDDDWG